MKFSDGIIHLLLMREVHHNGPLDEMRFIIRNHEVRFSKVEFGLITGLRFGVLPDTSRFVSIDNGLHHQYFGGKDGISSLELRDVLRRDGFDAFPWGSHMYSHSIFSFKHAFDGRRERFQRCQQAKGRDKHMQEAYNIYGLSYALLVIPELGTQFGTRVATDMSPQILKWALKIQLRGDRLLNIFTAHETRADSTPELPLLLEIHETSSERNRRLKGLSTGIGSVVTPYETPPPPTDTPRSSHRIPLPPTVTAGSSHQIPLSPTVTAVSSHRIPPPPTVTVGSSHGMPLPPTDTPGSSYGIPPSTTDTLGSSHRIPYGFCIPRASYGRVLGHLMEASRCIPHCVQPEDKHPTSQSRFVCLQPLLEYQWEKIMPRGVDGEVKTLGWKVLQYMWSAEDLRTVRGYLPVGTRSWHEVDMVLIPCNIGRQHWLVASVDLIARMIHILDLFRQEVPVSIRKRQVWPLRWFLPSILHQFAFHDDMPPSRKKFKRENMAFG
ncbi:hypothetical protein Ddye_026408 [Dipteronia dyeriana]|uniref:Ubiquitin-like protease family profile domain-containing protein n=1 Tax=Dipteronia dyeriana TaxID=168575 RepID=A0AAD9WQF9_9ROSI|nr:hypothetical protein Ddye_026408 [Dipteronia dyeriana]